MWVGGRRGSNLQIQSWEGCATDRPRKITRRKRQPDTALTTQSDYLSSYFYQTMARKNRHRQEKMSSTKSNEKLVARWGWTLKHTLNNAGAWQWPNHINRYGKREKEICNCLCGQVEGILSIKCWEAFAAAFYLANHSIIFLVEQTQACTHFIVLCNTVDFMHWVWQMNSSDGLSGWLWVLVLQLQLAAQRWTRRKKDGIMSFATRI